MPGWRFDGSRNNEPVERPADPAVRKANLHRIIRLFQPYRARLGLVSGLIVLSAGLGQAPARQVALGFWKRRGVIQGLGG